MLDLWIPISKSLLNVCIVDVFTPFRLVSQMVYAKQEGREANPKVEVSAIWRWPKSQSCNDTATKDVEHPPNAFFRKIVATWSHNSAPNPGLYLEGEKSHINRWCLPPLAFTTYIWFLNFPTPLFFLRNNLPKFIWIYTYIPGIFTQRPSLRDGWQFLFVVLSRMPHRPCFVLPRISF